MIISEHLKRIARVNSLEELSDIERLSMKLAKEQDWSLDELVDVEEAMTDARNRIVKLAGTI